MSYCSFCSSRDEQDLHRVYHDLHYGFPLSDDAELFGRLILEINQAGLSWSTMLKKEDNFRKAFEGFVPEKIAAFTESDIIRLLDDPGIIRNKLKINAVIYNAQKWLQIKEEFGSFTQWLDQNHPKTKDEWTKLFKKTFKFVGGEIVGEFLMSIGYLPGAHVETCEVYQKILELEPKWSKK